MQEKLAQKGYRYLSKSGATVRLNTTLLSASSGEVVLTTKERVQSRTIIVTAGVAPNPVVADLPVAKDRGRLKADEFCRVPGLKRVYAVGDNASIPNCKTGITCPPTFIYALRRAHAPGIISWRRSGEELRARTRSAISAKSHSLEAGTV